jgi:hypothetical protein
MKEFVRDVDPTFELAPSKCAMPSIPSSSPIFSPM